MERIEGPMEQTNRQNNDSNIRKLLGELDLRKHNTLPNSKYEDCEKEPKELLQWYPKARVNF